MKLAEWLLIPLVFAAAAVSTAAFAPVNPYPVNPYMDSSLGGFIFGVFGIAAITLTLAVRSR